MNKKAMLITLAVVLVIGTVAGLIAGGVINIEPQSATEKEFGKRVIKAEMAIVGYEDTVIEIELYPDVAPKTVDNFVKLCNEGFYDGLIFHRVVKDIIVQTGSPNGTGAGGSSTAIKGEFAANGFNNTIRHRRGVLSMARLPDNNNSATSQFFIVTCAEGSEITDFNGEYAAFGRIVSGMEIIDIVSNAPVLDERPVAEQKIAYIKIVK